MDRLGHRHEPVIAQVSPTEDRINRMHIANLASMNASQLADITSLKVSPESLKRQREKKKNNSPFNAEKYYPMLPDPAPGMRDRILLCLDLDETLVHSSFTPSIHKCDATIMLSEGAERAPVYIGFRPHVRAFIEAIAPLFEIAIFTASQSGYANQILDCLDPEKKLGPLRLYREHCVEVGGSRVKDLSLLGRSLDRIALADNSPATYMFQPRNAIPVTSWFDDPNDTELLRLIPVLRQLAAAKSVYDVLDHFNAYLMK